MSARKPRAATVSDARAVVFMASKRYGDRVFRVAQGGPNHSALLLARDRGWIWFKSPELAVVTPQGEREVVSEYLT